MKPSILILLLVDQGTLRLNVIKSTILATTSSNQASSGLVDTLDQPFLFLTNPAEVRDFHPKKVERSITAIFTKEFSGLLFQLRA